MATYPDCNLDVEKPPILPELMHLAQCSQHVDECYRVKTIPEERVKRLLFPIALCSGLNGPVIIVFTT